MGPLVTKETQFFDVHIGGQKLVLAEAIGKWCAPLKMLG